MSAEIEERIEEIPILRDLARYLKGVKLKWLEGLSLYDLLELYIIGIAEGALSNRAGSISFSFFMALFPFALFILNLIPYIPIEGFQQDFLKFVSEGVPPNTYYAIENIVDDILGGFETSRHVLVKRGFFQQYFVALGMSIILSLLLILTVAIIVVFEIFIQKFTVHSVLNEQIPLIVVGRYVFLLLMILVTTSILFKFGTKHDKSRSFISIGSVFTTILTIIISYFFGIWVIRFSQYNQLYGSIGTLLIVMFYIWINCMILLLGFELNTAVNRLKKQKKL